MSRRRHKERPESFSFDSFLDVVANVCGIIIKLILVAWAGARLYHGPVVSKPFVPDAVPEMVALAEAEQPDPLEKDVKNEIDAVARLQPGVLHDAASHEQDSFSDGLLDCPHYSRPEVLPAAAAGAEGGADLPVPPVLMSGHHAQIARWRREQQLVLTARRRPELIDAARARGELSKKDEDFLRGLTL